jgi:2-polyprenyl-3-methyl-5-hydroxy-6-metoxy-1,4-benzoquinol methylase
MKRVLLKFLLRVHTVIERLIRKVVVVCNNGIHPKHELMRYHEFFLDNVVESDTVLDIGCGIGLVSYDLARKVKKVVAVDKDPLVIREAILRNKLDNVEYITADITAYNFGRHFNVAVLSNVLEHIDGRIELLKAVAAIADKILVRVPMIDRDWITIYKKNMGLEYRLDKTHFIEYTYESFQKEIETAGLLILSYHVRFGELYAVLGKKSDNQ